MSVLRSAKMAHEMSSEEALLWFRETEFYNVPPYFLTHWKTHKKFFYAHGGLLAFEETASECVVAGEPLLPHHLQGQINALFAAFSEMANRRRKGVCGYYVGQSWRAREFSKVRLGASTVLDFDDYDLKAPRYKEVRRALRKGDQLQYQVRTVNKNDPDDQAKLRRLNRDWRDSKSSLDVRFLLSEPKSQHLAQDYEEWFAVEKDGELLAFCSLLPYARQGNLSFYLDNILHQPQSDPHALSFLISYLLEVLHDEGVYQFNFGLCPFAHTSIKGSLWVEKIFSTFYRFPLFYRAKGLHRFKRKFGGREEPEYCFFNGEESKMHQLSEMAGVTFEKRCEVRP